MAGKIVKESIDRFFEYEVHPETRTIYAGCLQVDLETGDSSGVDPHMAERIIKGLHILGATPDKPIKIILNTPGGDWYQGMAIYDAIKACPCYVTIEVLGLAMSMGSVILQAADERIIHPNATIMIHDGSDGFKGHARNFEIWAAQGKKLRHRMYEIYAERSGKDVKYWEKRCQLDFIMTAQQAVEEKLADEVFKIE